jgi:hypothetical protein
MTTIPKVDEVTEINIEEDIGLSEEQKIALVSMNAAKVLQGLRLERADVAVMACLECAIRLIQGGAGLSPIDAVDKTIEALYQIRAGMVADLEGR